MNGVEYFAHPWEFGARKAKESVNQTLDARGQFTAFRAAFSLQHLGHAHNRVKFGRPIDPSGMPTR